MIKKLSANAAAKRIAIFAFVFVLSSVLICLHVSSPLPKTYTLPANVMPTVQWIDNEPADNTQNTLTLLKNSPMIESHIEFCESLPQHIRLAAPPKDFVYLGNVPISRELQQHTYRRCDELDLDYALVLAVMWRESRFRTDVVNLNTNGTYDSGLMQINDINRQWLAEAHGIEDLLDPYQNIDAGTAMLAQFFSKYSENEALMAYQYGEAGMLDRAAAGITTNELTELVKQKRNEYRVMLNSAATAS